MGASVYRTLATYDGECGEVDIPRCDANYLPKDAGRAFLIPIQVKPSTKYPRTPPYYLDMTRKKEFSVT